ncbi:MFS transporter [Proteus alimentorum]|uniref:MFS transporter n=1 Tax=Proteus alimentorum TaxID=1973495 RepID=UPI000BFFEFC0|nr:MFS transporter [Proteus alimentorum]
MNDNKMTPLERKATWGLGTVFSLRMLGMFMVLPVLTTYGLQLQHATESLIGLAIGIYGLTQAIFQIPFGIFSDKFGRKPMIVFGLIIFIIGSLIAAFSDNIYGIILGRALQGAGAISAAVMALLSDLTREQNRTKAMAFIGISFGITFALALVLGPILTHIFGLHGLFWGIALLAFGGIIITLFTVPNSEHHILNRESGFVRGSVKKVLFDAQLLKLNTGIFSLHTLLMAAFVALPLVMSSAGLAKEKHWIVYLVTMLIAFITVLPFIIYAEKKRKMKQVFLFCIFLLIIAQAILILSGSSLWLIIAGIQVFFIGFNIMEALLPSLISKEAPAGYKGTAMGIYSTSQFLGVALGGILGGWLYQHYNAQTVFLGCLVIGLIWFFISLTLRQPSYVSSLRVELPKNLSSSQQQKLQQLFKQQRGVNEVVMIADEQSAYIKVDTKQTPRATLESLIPLV